MKTFEAVPDVAMDEDPNTGALVIVNGAPLEVAARASLRRLHSRDVSATRTYHSNRFGFVAPLFHQEYKKFTTLTQFGGFHDVFTGGDGLPALPGYDYTTGVGTFDITKQFEDLPSSFPS